jgi:Antitoxin Phd_YefM, type II toxin-antitoxin system
MKTVTVTEARKRLKALLDEVSSGHEVSVVRRGRRSPGWFLRSEEDEGCRPSVRSEHRFA